MSTQPNPGCSYPSLQLPPAVEDYLADLIGTQLQAFASELGKAQAKVLIIQTALADPTGAGLGVATSALSSFFSAEKQAAAAASLKEFTDDLADIAKTIEKFEKQAKRYTNLASNCPLPRVPNPTATGG